MSQKQLRKLRELREPDRQEVEAVAESSDESSDHATAFGFHALASSNSEAEPSEPEETPVEVVQVPPVETRTRKARRKKRRDVVETVEDKKTKSTEEDDINDILQDLQGDTEPNTMESLPNESPGSSLNPLAMRRQDFSSEAEGQRLFGRSFQLSRARKGPKTRGGEGKTLHHRRLFLVSPNEPWPKPDDTSQMVVDGPNGPSFDFKETDESKRSLEILQSVVSQEDPELLQRYLQRSPFSLEALLVMAEHHRRQAGHDQARELVKRAVYTVECAFAADFSPFEMDRSGWRPRVKLQMPDRSVLDWPGWSWLRTLWMHMHLLAGQGMHRTSLEVCKLLLAATLPQDPLRAVLWLDYLCLRSRQYKTISDLSLTLARACGHCGEIKEFQKLEFVFPNFAYSVGLAGVLQKSPDMSLLNHLTLDHILSDEDLEGDLMTFARLMRALLYFPGAVRPILEEAAVPLDSVGPTSWRWLLMQPPFEDALTYRHAQHSGSQGRISGAYAKLCGVLWKGEPVKVLHACAVRWVKLHESEIFQKDIVDARVRWANSTFSFSETLVDYKDVLPEDGFSNPPVPQLLEKALSARLMEEAMFNGMFRRTDIVPNMSIYSSPLILFFQSLMPWSVLDGSGATATPLLWKDIGRGLANVLKDTVLFAIEAATELVSQLASLLSSAVAMLQQKLRNRGH